MSSKKRKALKRDRRIKTILACLLGVSAIMIIVLSGYSLRDNGITIATYAYGAILMIIFFLVGLLMSQELKRITKKVKEEQKG